MYCPNCATANPEETKYCRSCGANLTLVPQALTGRLPGRRSRRRHRHGEREGPASLENGITKTFIGVGFLLVSAAVFFFFPGGETWWFWLLIPAFSMLGKGVAEIVGARYNTGPAQSTQTALPPVNQAAEFPPQRDPALSPPSVTEQTTRQLDPNTDPYRYRDRDAR